MYVCVCMCVCIYFFTYFCTCVSACVCKLISMTDSLFAVQNWPVVLLEKFSPAFGQNSPAVFIQYIFFNGLWVMPPFLMLQQMLSTRLDTGLQSDQQCRCRVNGQKCKVYT